MILCIFVFFSGWDLALQPIIWNTWQFFHGVASEHHAFLISTIKVPRKNKNYFKNASAAPLGHARTQLIKHRNIYGNLYWQVLKKYNGATLDVTIPTETSNYLLKLSMFFFWNMKEYDNPILHWPQKKNLFSCRRKKEMVTKWPSYLKAFYLARPKVRSLIRIAQ